MGENISIPWEPLFAWDSRSDRQQKPLWTIHSTTSSSEHLPALSYSLGTWRTTIVSTEPTSRMLSPGSFSEKAKVDDPCRDVCNSNNKTGNNPGIYKSGMVSSIMHSNILIRKNMQPTHTYTLAGPACRP